MNNKTTPLVILCCGLGSFNAEADHPAVAFGTEGAGPINTLSANPMPEGAWGIGLRTEILSNDAFSDAALAGFADQGIEDAHSLDGITSTSLSLAYGLSENLTLSLRLPYIERKEIRAGEIEDGEAESHLHGDSKGIGDITLLSQYRFASQDGIDLALHLGVKAPTGETDVDDDHGERYEVEFQPGSGSWDFLLGAAISANRGRFGYHANLLYNYTTEGDENTEIGDALFYNAALTYRLNGHDHASHQHVDEHTDMTWDLMLELNGETRQKNEIDGGTEGNSGGTLVYLSPGVRITLGSFSGFLSYGVPVAEHQNGVQTDVEGRLIAGVSMGF